MPAGDYYPSNTLHASGISISTTAPCVTCGRCPTCGSYTFTYQPFYRPTTGPFLGARIEPNAGAAIAIEPKNATEGL